MEQATVFNLNQPQARALTCMAQDTYVFAGRGTGKTVGIIAPWILHKVNEMPRSNGGFIGMSFTQIEERILQPLLMAFQDLGYKEHHSRQRPGHYVYGKRPPDHWERPLTPIIDYSHVLTFANGTTCEFISLHITGSANAKSLQWLVADEAKFLPEKKVTSEVIPVLRGHKRIFGASAWYGAKLFVTDKLSPNIHWLLAKRKLVDKEAVEAVIYFQILLNNERVKLIDASGSTADAIAVRIRKLEQILTTMRKGLVNVVEASAKDNIANLGADYFELQKRDLSDYEYEVAIENKDPTKIENGFYPDRSEDHLYNVARDQDISKPLGVVLDYQASLTPLVAFQVNNLVRGYKTLNYVDALYTKWPQGLGAAIAKFCERYSNRPNKHVYYFYDHTAVARQNGKASFCDEVEQHFKTQGWSITKIYMGQAPRHDVKYRIIQKTLQNKTNGRLQVCIHEERCAVMVLSMDQAGIKHSKTLGTQKDKSTETDRSFPQEQSTHFSDCFDQALWGVCELNLYPQGDDALPGARFGA